MVQRIVLLLQFLAKAGCFSKSLWTKASAKSLTFTSINGQTVHDLGGQETEPSAVVFHSHQCGLIKVYIYSSDEVLPV